MGFRHRLTGPKTFAEWVEAYEERGNEYKLSRGERVVWHPDHGFFTFLFDAANMEILIPKMCGDGKHWRPLIYEMAKAARGLLGVKGVYCCTEYNPRVWQRVHGGRLVKMEHTYDFTTGKSSVLWYFSISPGEYEERRRSGNDDILGAGVAVNSPGDMPR
jgi:hypothetical protein